MQFVLQATIESANSLLHEVSASLTKRSESLGGPLQSLFRLIGRTTFKWMLPKIKKLTSQSAEVCLNLERLIPVIESKSPDKAVDNDGELMAMLEELKDSAKSIIGSAKRLNEYIADLGIDHDSHHHLVQLKGVMEELYATTNHLQWIISEHDANLYRGNEVFQASSKEEADALLSKLMA